METLRALSDVSAVGASASAAESLKYRLSCDRCQNTKVRCSRDKPSCKRCTRRGLSCVYSPLGRIGRPRKATYEDTRFGDDENDDDISQSPPNPSSTLSPDNSATHDTSTTATILEDAVIEDIRMVDSTPPTSKTNSSAVHSWISDHLRVPPQSQAQETHAAVDLSTLLDRSDRDSRQTPSQALDLDPGVNCYVRILAETTKLEQALARTKLAPFDLVLEAESDFSTLRYNLITCTGHADHSPHPENPETGIESPQDSATRHIQPCLTSDRPVLLSLALLAERIVGMLEDMFRFAARSAHNMDKASDILWTGAPGIPASPSARRLQRSLRSTMAWPCAMPVVEANRDVRIENFLVQDQAKSDAVKRILKLRVDKMLAGLKTLKSAQDVRQREHDSGQLREGPLDWGGSSTLLGNMAGALLDDLVRRLESTQGAMVLL